ncbi:hypothetical protein C1H46_013885 [Malus baccata]|uniref:Beta-amylase n=1 Tax=Malus baccata TaxID=106549 RepID=A0A540MP29_MALBA|nr:hypothetical protein C1H46_013885 [Malus baccata]
MVRDSAGGTLVGENVDHNKVEDSSLEKFEERDFTGTPCVPVYIMLPVSGIHWWYKTASHPAELTAGFYNSCNRDGYAPISAMLKKHEAALNFTCVEMRTLDQHEGFPEALADPEGLVWQVLNSAWDANIPVAGENALTCFDREGDNKILENANPWNDPDGRHLSAFTYLRLSPVLIERHNLTEFERFVKRMHGKSCKTTWFSFRTLLHTQA